MSSYHGWTHRPKSEGGTDPTGPAKHIYWATQVQATTAVTTPWTVQAIPPNGAAGMSTNDLDNSYFEDVTDGSGTHGIRIIQEGLFLLRIHIDVFFAATGAESTRRVPPYIRADMIANWDLGGTDFGFPSAPNQTVLTVQHLSSAVAYLPDEDTDAALNNLPDVNHFVLSATDILRVRDLTTGLQNLPLDFAWVIWSFGGTVNWNYAGGIKLFRLDDALPNNSIIG